MLSARTPEEIYAEATSADVPRGFRAAIQNAPVQPALIAEVKKASPSEGVLREDFDPVALAVAFADAGAQCLSVLTDRQYFQGMLQNLSLCHSAVSLPILRKDFLIDPVQVDEARGANADAVLLIAARLDDASLRTMLERTRFWGMDALVEVHTPDEAMRALDCGAEFLGINNRDLDTFATDLSTTERIAAIVGSRSTIVSESALLSASDVDRVRDAGVDAVLVGTALCRASDPGGKVKEIMGW